MVEDKYKTEKKEEEKGETNLLIIKGSQGHVMSQAP